jgi:hypothetical protein
MADRTITVLTAATESDLMTLDEGKLLMGLSLADTGGDAQLELFTSINSATIARLCNRTFAREEVREEWRELGCNLQYPGYYFPDPPAAYYSGTSQRSDATRLFLSHWPVHPGDIESVESPMGTVADPSTYEIEEDSGKLFAVAGTIFQEPVVVTYWGGYRLPDESPLPLKQACSLLNVQSKLLANLGTMAGIRLLSHKSARVAFHDPLKLLEAAMGGKGSPTEMQVMNLLYHYMRLEV